MAEAQVELGSGPLEGRAAGPAPLPGRLWPVVSGRPAALRFWATVAAFGALWGGLEITLGAFLHAVRLPFGGTMLAMVAAALLVAQRQILPARGLSIATGVVAALCKSVSPGGVILGPMVAITVEALLVELALMPAQKARPTAALAGLLVVVWALSQKVLSQYVYYGGTVVDLYLALLSRAASSLGLGPGQGLAVVGSAVGLAACIGAAVALGGRRVGLRVAAGLASERRPS